MSYVRGVVLVPSLQLITGPTGAGKSIAARARVAEVPGAVLLSAESQQAFYERELAHDESNFRGGADKGTEVSELLGEAGRSHPLFAAFRLAPLWARGYRQLSTGEARKVLLLRAVLEGPSMLVLDEPFDGLDGAACADLADAVVALSERLPVVLVGNLDTHRLGARTLIAALREVIVLERGAEVFRGTSDAWLAREATQPRSHASPPIALGSVCDPMPSEAPLVELHGGRVAYGAHVVFEGLEFRVRRGEHTLIEGPNGSGKSTLLELITGDHPQAYVNDLTLFGRRRGTGESVWDIKKRIGTVSARLHRDYRVGGSVEDALLSGLYDSIGVYQAPQPSHRERARAWLDWLELGLSPGDAFRELSHGMQRLVLVARAAIKLPPLIVLDEPTAGLDPDHSLRVLELVQSLCTQTESTVLFVTHRPEERAHWDTHIGGATLTLG
jgi:molybdate transport system ATP-binding protein